MRHFLFECFLLTLFIRINGIKIQKHRVEDPSETDEKVEEYATKVGNRQDDDSVRSNSHRKGSSFEHSDKYMSQESNNELLKCLKKLFEELFPISQEEHNEDTDSMMTEKLYENTECIIKSIESSESLVQLLGKFFDSIYKLKTPETENITTKEKRKALQTIYKMALQIANEFRKDKKMLSELRGTITSFLEQTQLPDPTDPDDEVSQLLSMNFFSCLAYHFNATFQFNLPKEIKQQDKLLKLLLHWNAGCIAIAEDRSKRVLFYLAKIFKQLLNLSQSGSKKEQKEFYSNIKGITDEVAYKYGENTTVTAYRIIISRLDKVEYPKPKDPEIKITRSTFDGIPVIIQEPVKPASKLRTGIMLFHGGGWVYRNAERYFRQAFYLAKHLDAVVISVEYRQSPEYKFPVPVNDCLQATEYFMKHAKQFKVDPRRIAVAGDSAGGNMAASVSLMLRDKKHRKPKVQVLIYPCIQMFDFNLPSYQQNKEMFGLYKDEMVEFYLTYAGLNSSYKEAISNNKHICDDMKHSKEGSYIDVDVIPDEYKKNYIINETDCDPTIAEDVKKTMLSPYIFPLMSNDLSELPPSLIINGEFDILRDEGLLYGARLKSFNIALEEHVIKGGYHGTIDMLDIVDIGKEVMDIIVNYLKKNL